MNGPVGHGKGEGRTNFSRQGREKPKLSKKGLLVNTVFSRLFLKTGGVGLLLLVGFARGELPSPDHPDPASRILAGIELTIINRFQQADSVFQGLIRDFPDRPWGYFYRGANLQAWMVDHEDYSRMKAFHFWMERCIAIVDSLERIKQATAWDYFYQGSAYLYRSFLEGKQRRWWPAYRHSLQGVKRLEKALELDSTLFDAYLGIGSYKFWKSKKAGILTRLPILKNETAVGIALVRRALEKGRFVTWIGRDQLAWILMENGQLQEALAIARENFERFPQSRFFGWTLARVYEKTGHLAEARQLYQWLLEQIRRLPENNHYNEVILLIKLAELACKRGEEAKGALYLKQIGSIALSPEVKKRLQKRLSRLKDKEAPCGASYQTRGAPPGGLRRFLEREFRMLQG